MPITIDHANKRVFVLGARQELGQALVRAFRAQGAGVACDSGDTSLKEGGIETYQKLVKDAISKLGGLDILITCTGVEDKALMEKASLETWDSAVSRPLKAAFFTTQAATSALKASRGAIVNVTSILGQMGAPPGLALSAAAMACMVHHTRMMALRLSPEGVRVNCVCHGYLSELERLGISQGSEEHGAPTAAQAVPLGRLTKPEDVVSSVLFLASPLANFVTGAVLSADGGTYSGN